MTKNKTIITVLSGLVVCSLISVLLLGLYAAGLIGDKKPGKAEGGTTQTPETADSPYELRDGMTLNEFRAYLAVAKPDSFNCLFQENKDAEIQIRYFTKNGCYSVDYTAAGEFRTSMLAFIEDGRYYEKNIDSDKNVKERVVDLEGADIMLLGNGAAASGKGMVELILATLSFATGSDFDEGDVSDVSYDFTVKSGVATLSVGDTKIFEFKDINSTTLPIDDDFKNYKEMTSTETFGEYKGDAATGKVSFTGFVAIFGGGDGIGAVSYIVKKYTVSDKIDGAAVTDITSQEDVYELVIPESVTNIGNYTISNAKIINYKGTKAQWAMINVGENTSGKPLTVHCSDGDVYVQKA